MANCTKVKIAPIHYQAVGDDKYKLVMNTVQIAEEKGGRSYVSPVVVYRIPADNRKMWILALFSHLRVNVERHPWIVQ